MRSIVNFVISAGVLLGLSYFGWLHIYPLAGMPWPWSYIGAAALVSLAYTLLDLLASWLCLLLIGAFGTVGAAAGAVVGSRSRQTTDGLAAGACAGVVLGCLVAIPFAMVAAVVCLMLVSWFIPGLLGLTSNIWLTILSVLALSVLQIPGNVNVNISSQE